MRITNMIAGLALALLPSLVFGGVSPDGSKVADNDGAVESQKSMSVYASDKTAQVQFERSGGIFGLNSNHARIGFLTNETRDNTLTGSVLFDANSSGIPGLSIKFGTKAFAGLLALENTDIFGFGASLEAAYLFPVERFPLTLSGSFSYAPDILTFGQADRIIDWHVRASLPLTDNIEGFTGLRFLQFDTRAGQRELDKRIHIGVRWNI